MLRFTADHEWLRIDGDVAVVGITEHAQEQLGDLVFVELPASGKSFEKGAPAAVVESCKAASDVYAPISGQIVETNESIVADPTIVNSDPLGNGWFFKLKIADPSEIDSLMDEKDLQGAARVKGIAMQSNRLMRSSMDVTMAERAFDPFSFAQRHIGPQADDVRRMLQVVNAPSLDALIDEAMPGDVRQTRPLSFGPALSEPELLAKMRGIASRNQRDGFVDRPRLLRHAPAARHSAQRAGKSRLVHGLYAVSGGDQSGAPRGVAEFPDHDCRPHWARNRQRISAR